MKKLSSKDMEKTQGGFLFGAIMLMVGFFIGWAIVTSIENELL